MSSYQSESFYRAKITTPILSSTAVPITIVVSKVPTISNGLLTISPNTEYEEIVEYNNINGTNMTIDIIKRGILPSSILLTTNWVDYNNTAYYKEHTQNDIIRADVNHIHINQGIGNTTLATNTWVGISKLSVAAVDAWNPIVVGNNDPRVGDASTTQKATVKLSVAPVSAANPIAVGDNDTRLTPILATEAVNWVTKLSIAPAGAWVPIAVGDNDNRLLRASTTVEWRVELATDSEVNAGTTTWWTGAMLAVGPDTLKTKTDSIANTAATALANDVRLNSTLTATWVWASTFYSSSQLMPRWWWVSLWVVSTTAYQSAWFVETSVDWSTWWTDSWYVNAATNSTSSKVFVPIKWWVYVRIKLVWWDWATNNSALWMLFY